MTRWDEVQTVRGREMTDLICDILRDAGNDGNHGTGYAFLTTYQIAAEIEHRFNDVFVFLGYPVGGENSGPYALTTFIAGNLPQHLSSAEGCQIEMAFLSANRLKNITIDGANSELVATTNQVGFGTTMFRLRS
jgi:hypothetical protein